MDGRALLQNQWFQLCLLVAALSAGALGFDLALGRFGGLAKTTPLNGPTPTASPAVYNPPVVPFKKQTPKARGQWIVDANGAADSDGRDLNVIAANLSDGDTLTIRPGTYEGGFEIMRNVRVIGQGNVIIQCTTRDTILVSARQATLQHLVINSEAGGDKFSALDVIRDAGLEVVDCYVSSRGKFNAYIGGTANLAVQDSRFQTHGTGCALKVDGAARAKIERCVIADNNWGVEAVHSAQIEVLGCTFSNNGLANGNGNIMNISGGQARAVVSASTFLNNRATLVANESASLVLNGCTFRDNGVTGEAGNSNDGLISASTAAKVSLVNVTLQSNRQGLTALSGGSLEIAQTHITMTGIATENQVLKYYACAIYGGGAGCTISVTNSSIADSVSDAIMLAGGASVRLEDVSVSNSNLSGLELNVANQAPVRAELSRSHFLGNHIDGVYASAGSTLEATGCEFSDNRGIGVEINDPDTKANITNSIFRNNKNSGLMAHTSAVLTASGCTLEGNARGAQAGSGGTNQGHGSVTLDRCIIRANTIFGVGAFAQSLLTINGGFLGGQHQNIAKDSGGVVRQTQ